MQRALIITCFFALLSGQPGQADPDSLAEAFGRMPDMYGAELSPNGQHVSYLSMSDFDIPMVFITDIEGNISPVLASKDGEFDVYWCDWANDERLLCGFVGINRAGRNLFSETRLVAVNLDGSNRRVLLQRRAQRSNEFAQFQDDIVDWLPDDPEHVLVEVPETDGTGVARVDIYDGGTSIEERVRDAARDWISDGHGRARVRHIMTTNKIKWQYRLTDDKRWHLLHESVPGDDTDFFPLGFGEDRNELLVFRPYEGRLALWAHPLSGGEDRLVFAHPAVDAGGWLRIGKFRRLAGISYITDSPQMHYFDARAEDIIRKVSAAKPETQVSLVNESWDRNTYLLHIAGPNDAGRYYRLDLAAKQLASFWPVYPALEGRQLAAMQAFPYEARDGVSVPAYLTLPPDGDGRNLPAVLLPHGGPESRDYLAFDFLAHYLAARGYAVLQANYRGSGGYGGDWSGAGGFKAWRQAIDDLTDGTRYLIEAGIVDPARICTVGWSYGGYAALLSAIEEPALYRCAVSIAGVTDPMMLIQDYRAFLNKRWVREFVGTDEEVIKRGSPLNRVAEIQVPVLLFHGDKDLNVSVQHSRALHKRLKRKKKESELVVYKDAAHSLSRNAHRTDLLQRLGAFLDEHTVPLENSAAPN